MESKRARAALRRSRMSELANRSAVIALTMNNRTAKSAADLCAEYIRNETVSRRLYRPKMQDFPISGALRMIVCCEYKSDARVD